MTLGTLDFICNHVGNEMWMNRLQWTGQEGFNEAEFVDFKVKGEVAGKYKTYGNLSVRDVAAYCKDVWCDAVEWQRIVLLTRCSCSRSTERDTWCPSTSPRRRCRCSTRGSAPRSCPRKKGFQCRSRAPLVPETHSSVVAVSCASEDQ